MIINETDNFHDLQESNRMMKSQSSDIERNNKLIENGKRMGTGETVKQNKSINNNSKSQV